MEFFCTNERASKPSEQIWKGTVEVVSCRNEVFEAIIRGGSVK